MALTLTEKILSSHLKTGTLERGNPIGISIDQTLTQDATGTMAFLEFESMGVQGVVSDGRFYSTEVWSKSLTP